MAKVGTLKVVIDPAFLAALQKATEAVAQFGEFMKRDDLVQVVTEWQAEE